MEIIIAVIIAISGWIANHILSLRAQRKSFNNHLQNEARISLTTSLRSYLDWIDETYNSYNLMHVKWVMTDETLRYKIDPILLSKEFREIVKKQSLRLLCNDLLEEYEPIFPQVVEARNHLWQNHAYIFSKLNNISSSLNTIHPDEEEIERQLNSDIGSKLAGQKWFARDLIVCIQNIALGNITDRSITEKEYSSEIKHTRLMTNKKMEIVFIKK